MLALIALTMWPPVSGKVLIVPLTGMDANAVARVAVAGGAALIGAGPFRRSLVVSGSRSSLARHYRPGTLLVMAAPPAGCGGLIS